MDHITFDLETLGNTSNAPIVQIGAVKFNDEGITDTFLRNIDLTSLEPLGFKLDYSSINWWLNQSNEAIKSVFGDNLEKISLNRALYEFQEWIGKTADYNYWSHATFDPPILINNFKTLKKPCPIPFRLHRDIRTLSLLGGKVTIKREGIHHNALDDCIYQAKYISALLNNLKK